MIRFKTYFLAFFLLVLTQSYLQADYPLYLRDHLSKAQKNDFIVAYRSKNYSLLRIYDKTENNMVIEEITAPARRKPRHMSWQEWIENNAPGNTSWIRYKVDLANGQMKEFFSVTRNSWYEVPPENNLFSTLLNLTFEKVPPRSRKCIGVRRRSSNPRHFWQPKMIINGETIPGVRFDAWRTRWPKDGSELSGKQIEIYLPEESDRYPSYFPYWLEIRDTFRKMSVRIIDTGHMYTTS